MASRPRSSQRRSELIAATRRVVARRGLAAASVRAVAAEADVSAGSVLYHFDSFEELMYAAVEGVMEEMYGRRAALASEQSDPRARFAALVEAGVPDQISDSLRVVYESVPLLREQPQFRPLHRSIVERQVGLYRSTIEIGQALGVFIPAHPAEVIARNVVALEDAYDLYPLIGLEHDPARYRSNILAYAALALGTDFHRP